MESVGVRELRQHASRWLERVQHGESFTVTDRGRPIAVLSPISPDPVQLLIDAGVLVAPTAAVADEEPWQPLDLPGDPTGELARLRADER